MNRLVAVATRAPALTAHIAKEIRSVLFAVLETPTDDSNRCLRFVWRIFSFPLIALCRYHLPLATHEALVQNALVPLCTAEHTTDGAVAALLSCASGATLCSRLRFALLFPAQAVR